MASKQRSKTAPLLAPLFACALLTGWLWHSGTKDEQVRKASPEAARAASPGRAEQTSKQRSPEVAAPSAGAQSAIENLNVSRWQAGTAWGLEQDPACRAFSAWAQNYSAAPAARLADLEAQGIKLATARRAALKDLISIDPQAALASAVPAAIRQGLPQAVSDLLEERVSGMGEIKLLAVRPRASDPEAAPYRRSVTLGDRSYGGFVYGERENEGATARDSVHGIAVDDRLALAESRLRLLEPGESPDPAKPVVLDLRGTHAVSETAPVALESGEGVVYSCCRRDLAAAERKWVLASGGPVPSGGGPNATPYRSTGNRSVVVLLARMSGGPSMLTQAQAQTGIDQVTTWLNQSSFQQLDFTVRTVTPELTLPKTQAQYLALGESGASGDGPSTLLADARAAAATLGAAYNPANFDFDIVVFEETFNFAGLGTVGGKGNWIQIGTVGQFETSTTAHEFGHNLGLNHAGCWVRPSGSLNTIDPAGTFRDYGSIYDALGLGGYPNGQYSAHYKKLLGWIPPANVHTISAPTGGAGVRIYAHDAGVALDPARHYGIRVNVADHVGAGIRDYWMDVRTLFTDRPSSQNGVTLQWGDQIGSPQGSCLLDTTPAPNTVGGYSVLGDFVDAPLALNSTFTDSACGITITPVATGGSGADKWVDVSVTTPDADLTALSLSVGSLSPTFSSSTLGYTASVPSTTTSLTVTPTASSASATIQVRVNGGAFANVSTGTASGALALVPGPNMVEVKVTAAGGLWSKTYTASVSTIPVVAGTGYGAIPDGLSGFPSPGAPRDITFTVSGRTGSVTNVLVEFTLQPAHTYCSDVVAVLIAPDSTQHTVCALSHLDDDSRMAGPYLFSDAAVGPFSTAATAAGGNVNVPSGSYRTQNGSDTATSLAAFFSSKAPNGTWTLRFTDRFAGDTGSVSAANLYIATGGAPVTQPKSAMVRQPNGSRLLTLTEAVPNASYHLQRSTNLTAWPNLTTVTTSATGTATYTDSTAAAPSYFYRFVSVSP